MFHVKHGVGRGDIAATPPVQRLPLPENPLRMAHSEAKMAVLGRFWRLPWPFRVGRRHACRPGGIQGCMFHVKHMTPRHRPPSRDPASSGFDEGNRHRDGPHVGQFCRDAARGLISTSSISGSTVGRACRDPLPHQWVIRWSSLSRPRRYVRSTRRNSGSTVGRACRDPLADHRAARWSSLSRPHRRLISTSSISELTVGGACRDPVPG